MEAVLIINPDGSRNLVVKIPLEGDQGELSFLLTDPEVTEGGRRESFGCLRSVINFRTNPETGKEEQWDFTNDTGRLVRAIAANLTTMPHRARL